MTDQVPELLEFETLKAEPSKIENILKLEDPPVTESDINTEIEATLTSDKLSYNEEIIDHDELLNLHEPPEEEEKEISDGKDTDEAISQFAQNLIDPIVKEALKLQNAEMEDSITDEVKVDSCGDKKSEKSLSDDGFEYVKADDINSSSGTEQNNEDINQVLDGDKLNKTMDDLFEHEDLKIEDPSEIQSNSEERNDIIEENEVVESSIPVKLESKSPDEEASDEGYDFDLQDIIKEYEANVPQNKDVPEYKMEEMEDVRKCDKTFIETDETKMEIFEAQMILDSVIISDNDICRKFKDIVCWKDPVMSSVVLSVIMVIELGLILDYSIISLMAYSGLLLLFSSFFYKVAVKFNLVKKCDQSNCNISVTSDDVQLCVDCVLKWIEYLFNEIRSLTYVVSFTKNLKAFTFFWILTYIGQWFNLLSLIFMGTIILFSLPIIYTTYKTTIDHVLDRVRGQIKDSINNFKSKFQQILGRRV